MIRDTSQEAYNDIQRSGVVGAQALSILNAIKFGVDYSLQEIVKSTGIPINAVSGRCNDLKKAGYLEEGDKRKCTITKRTIHPVRKK